MTTTEHTDMLSKCHRAPYRSVGGIGDFSDGDKSVTMHAECTVCGEPCDLISPTPPTEDWKEQRAQDFERFVGAFGVEEDFVVEARKLLYELLTAAEARGEKAMLDKVLKALPPEKIIHEYMTGKKDPRYAWNEYRAEALKSLTSLHD